MGILSSGHLRRPRSIPDCHQVIAAGEPPAPRVGSEAINKFVPEERPQISGPFTTFHFLPEKSF